MAVVTITREAIDFGRNRIVQFNETDIRAYTRIKLMKFSSLDYVSLIAEQINLVANERRLYGRKQYLFNKSGKFCVFKDNKGNIQGSINFSELNISDYKKKLEIEYYGANERDIPGLARSLESRIMELELRDVGSRLYTVASKDGRTEIAKGVNLYFTQEYELKLMLGR